MPRQEPEKRLHVDVETASRSLHAYIIVVTNGSAIPGLDQESGKDVVSMASVRVCCHRRLDSFRVSLRCAGQRSMEFYCGSHTEMFSKKLVLNSQGLN